ncbi:MAG: Hsp20/alpha crystallin family protein [Chlorobiaceae bacterium]
MSLALFKRDHFKHFDDVLNDNITPFFSSLVCPSFKVDVAEDGMAFFIEADMPGLNKKDIKVELEDDVLTISAKRTQSEDDKKKGFHRAERSWGCLCRSFTVGDNVDGDNIEATYDNGVLQVKVPKIQPQQILVKDIPVR